MGFAVVGLASYLLGHFLSVIASLCLDPIYDWWRDTHGVYQDGWPDSATPAKPLNSLWQSLKELADEHEDAGVDITVAGVTLRIASAGAAAEMDHLEADQKFFRGLILVLLFAWLTFFWDWNWKASWFWAGVALLFFPTFPFRIIQGKWPVWAARTSKRRVAIVQLSTVLLLLVCWIGWFTLTPQMSAQPRAASAGPTDNVALSVTASAGSMSVSAHSADLENGDVLWRLRTDHPTGFASVLLFALTLSVVRFVQQRLKYSEFVYRAYRIVA